MSYILARSSLGFGLVVVLACGTPATPFAPGDVDGGDGVPSRTSEEAGGTPDADTSSVDAGAADVISEETPPAPACLDCDGNGSCETDPRTSAVSCGTCGNRCALADVCASGACAAAIDHGSARMPIVASGSGLSPVLARRKADAAIATPVWNTRWMDDVAPGGPWIYWEDDGFKIYRARKPR